MTITHDTGTMHITITGPSTQFFGSDLHTSATVELIQQADTTGWEKHQIDHGGSVGDAEDQFSAAILGAIARHAAVTRVPPAGTTVAALLRQMIDDLVTKGRLTTILTDGGERDPDDA